MTEDIHQRAKSLFTELVECDEETRRRRLEEIGRETPELASEVSSLLEYHTAQSLVMPPVGPRIRTRSTLSTTYQTRSFNWLRGPLQGLMVAAPLFVLGLAVATWFHRAAERELQQSLQSALNAEADHLAEELKRWVEDNARQVRAWLEDESLHQAAVATVAEAESLAPDADRFRERMIAFERAQAMAARLLEMDRATIQFTVWDRRMLVIADSDPERVGQFVDPEDAETLKPVLQGVTKISLSHGPKNRPSVGISSPLRSADGSKVLGAIRIHSAGASEQLLSVLSLWPRTEIADVYLIDGEGTLVSTARSQQVIPKGESATLLSLRCPQKALSDSKLTAAQYQQLDRPLAVQQLLLKQSGTFEEPYRNYVGELVAGGWRWLPELNLGLVVEKDYAPLIQPLHWQRRAYWIATGLFVIGLLALTCSSSVSSLSRRKLRDLSEVGPYQVQELLGEGGMGRVYLAEHALLCRQSAVKVLTKGDKDLSAIGRFEREVQLASQLTHPNTIAIYDFGRNRDGLFYYAMEYINGAHLGQLIDYAGPLEPGRCIYILQQLCRALIEAHQAGVVHRDIKPQNIMVCNRGGEPDFVKLFDYGLVKSFVPGVTENPSQTKVVVGTPRFMAPERLNSPWLADPRVDVYSVGALAYFLLTAQLPPLVTVGDGMDSEQPGVETLDLPPSVVEFGGILSVCMSVEPSARPSSMSSMIRELDELSKTFPWSREDSVAWWQEHEAKLLHMVKNKRKDLSPQKLD